MNLRKMLTIMAFTLASAATAQASTHPSEAELAACKTAMDHHTQVCTADHASKACQDATKNVDHACAYQAHTSAQPSAPATHEPTAPTAPVSKPKDCLTEKHAAASECGKTMVIIQCLRVLKSEEDKCNKGQPHDFGVWKTHASEKTDLAKKCMDEKHAAVNKCKSAVQCIKKFGPEEKKCNAGQPYTYAVE